MSGRRGSLPEHNAKVVLRSTAAGAQYVTASTWPHWSPLGTIPSCVCFYLRLRAADKPAKVALTATMRKLLIVLNSALKPHLNYA